MSLREEKDLKTQGRRGEEGPRMMESEVGVMCPQAQEVPGCLLLDLSNLILIFLGEVFFFFCLGSVDLLGYMGLPFSLGLAVQGCPSSLTDAVLILHFRIVSVTITSISLTFSFESPSNKPPVPSSVLFISTSLVLIF